jgi:hypothetical protein
VELKSVLRPSRFGFQNKQVAVCESSLTGDDAKDGTSCAPLSREYNKQKDVGYNDSRAHADCEGVGRKRLQPQRRTLSSRMVRGLWDDERDCCCSFFAQLQVEIISEGIFSFLTLEERVMSAMTCRRFAYCSQQPGCWVGVDATSYVTRLYHVHLTRASNELAARNGSGSATACSSSSKSPQELAKERTSAALIAMIAGHKNDIERLVVRDIDHRLSSDVAAMGIGACWGLTMVELSDYLELTDASISALFLSRFCGGDDSTQTIRSRRLTIPPQRCLATKASLNGGRKIVSISPRFKLRERENTMPPRRQLSILRLERCPLLTDKVIRLIGTNCSGLSTLSLRGCKRITDSGLLPLSPMISCSIQSPPASPITLGRSISTPNKVTGNSLSSLSDRSSPSSVAMASSPPPSPSFLSIFDRGIEDLPSTRSCRLSASDTSDTFVEKTVPSTLISPKEIHCDDTVKYKRCLSSLDLAYTGVSAKGITALFSSGGDNISMSNLLDELSLSSANDDSKTNLNSVAKLRTLLRKPDALNFLVGVDD